VWQVDGFERRRCQGAVHRLTEKDHLMLKKVVIALVASSIAMGATACNTVKGAGQDVQSVGEAADKAM
jgi:predicted small secreted protein